MLHHTDPFMMQCRFRLPATNKGFEVCSNPIQKIRFCASGTRIRHNTSPVRRFFDRGKQEVYQLPGAVKIG